MLLLSVKKLFRDHNVIVVFWVVQGQACQPFTVSSCFMATFYCKLGLHAASATKDTCLLFQVNSRSLRPIGCLIENRKDLGGENAIVEGILVQISPITSPKENNG